MQLTTEYEPYDQYVTISRTLVSMKLVCNQSSGWKTTHNWLKITVSTAVVKYNHNYSQTPAPLSIIVNANDFSDHLGTTVFCRKIL